jgi:hypothetical protein
MAQQNRKAPMCGDPYRGCMTIVESDEQSAEGSLRSLYLIRSQVNSGVLADDTHLS